MHTENYALFRNITPNSIICYEWKSHKRKAMVMESLLSIF